MKLGSTDISKIYLGNTEVSKAYLGSVQVHGSSLPYDAEVEYLETDGLAYIDTDISTNGTLEFETKMKTVPKSSGGYAYFGSYLTGQSSTSYRYFCVKNGNTNQEQFGYGKSVFGNYSATTAIRTMSYKGTTYKVDNSSYTARKQTYSFDVNIWIFRVSGYGRAGSGNRVYYFKLWKNSVLVRDYIPVRVGTTGYLYDRVSGQLFGNVNETGSFVLGNDVTN